VAENPKVSVVIATYNRANYLRDTVESVLHQSFRDFELIVIDDGSTDDNGKILIPYSSQLRYIYQANSEPSSARNVGVQHARAPLGFKPAP
jgi:glycosyltransferase involved in cell wall biosynthesis